MGTGIQPRTDRAPAAAFVARTSALIKAKTGDAPEVAYLQSGSLAGHSAGMKVVGTRAKSAAWAMQAGAQAP